MSKSSNIGVFIVVTTCLIALLTGFIILIALLYKRKRDNYNQNLEMQKIDYEKKLLGTQLEMQEQTMKHISQELHDNINSLLHLAKISLKDMQEQEAGDVQPKVTRSLKYVMKAMEDLRYLSQTLNGEYINRFGLQNAVEQELDYIRRLNKFETVLELDGTPEFYKDNKNEVIIFRIIQEALSNSMKHGIGATRLLVKMQYTPTHLHIAVCDNGKSWKETTNGENLKNGMGLTNMAQRAEMAGGQFDIEHIPLQGTTVSLTIPIKA